MRNAIFAGIAILFGGICVAEEAPKPTPDVIGQPKIIIPVVPVLDESQVPEEDHPAPAPKPYRGPVPVNSLSEDTWYVVESQVQLIVLHSPSGHVAVQPEEGPVKVRGRFADGTGKTETRNFTSKYLYFVNAVKAGSIELLIVPVGVSAESEVIRQPLTVMGLDPNPPPKPDPPKPEPNPKPEPQSDSLMVEIVEDPLERNADTAIVLNALAEWNALKDKGHDWRLYSIRTGEEAGKAALKAAEGTPIPAMVIRDKASKKVLRVVPLPPTIADVKRVLSELTGGIL
jgi:hypothetical protein